MGSKDTHLHAVFPVSTSHAKGVRLACASLRGKLRYVHRWALRGVVGGVSETRERLRQEISTHQHQNTIQRAHHRGRGLRTAKLQIDLIHLLSDLKCSGTFLTSTLARSVRSTHTSPNK